MRPHLAIDPNPNADLKTVPARTPGNHSAVLASFGSGSQGVAMSPTANTKNPTGNRNSHGVTLLSRIRARSEGPKPMNSGLFLVPGLILMPIVFGWLVGGRMIGTSFALVTVALQNYAPGPTPFAKLA